MHITDEVVLAGTKTNTVLFRWHLGTEKTVTISGKEKQYTVTFSNTDIRLEADVPLVVTQRFAPDNTLAGHVSEDNPKNIHTCLVVQSVGPVEKISLSTLVTSE
jgi:hypothetical protein